jgi:type I restriction enzyme S subunit
MGEWYRLRLGDFAPFSYGKSLPERQRHSGDCPVFGSNGIVGWHTSSLIKTPMVVVGRKGSVGEVHFAATGGWPIDTTFYVTGGPERDIRFTYYLLKHLDMRHMSMDSAVPGLNRDAAHNLNVLIPPLSEQRAIAEVLGALDDKIEANRRIVGLCEKLAVALASLRPPKIALNAVARRLHEMVSSSALGEDEVEHFSLPAFDSGGLPMRTAGSSIKSGKFKLEGPAVLVSKLNPHIPRVWLAQPEGSGPAVTSTEFVVLAPKGRCPVEVLWAMCATPQFSTSMLKMAKGTTGSHQRVIPDDVLSIEVQSPQDFSDAERDIIVTATRLAQSMRRESADLAVTRDVLLPKLLSGELRVRDAERLVEEVV